MDEQHDSPNAQAHDDNRCNGDQATGAPMVRESPPLPVAMRADELTEQDFEALYQRALEIRAEQPETPPRKIPMGKSVPVSA